MARMPERLDEEELADWRAGRNAVYQLAALTVGARLAVADAVAGNDAALEVRERQMEELERQGRYPSGPCVPAVSRALLTSSGETSQLQSTRSSRLPANSNASAVAGHSSTWWSSRC